MTDREFLRKNGFRDSAKDSIRRSIVKWLAASKGTLKPEELAYLARVIEHSNETKS
jgi:hypothetical protein